MKYLALSLAVLAIAGCSTRVDLGAAAELAELDAEIVPRVSTKSAIATFDQHCYRNGAQPGRVVASVKSDGYKLLVTDRRANLFGYAHPTKPMVAVIDDPGEPACMTIVQRDPDLKRAYESFVKARRPDAESVQLPGLDSTMVASNSPTLVFARKIDGTDELLMLIAE